MVSPPYFSKTVCGVASILFGLFDQFGNKSAAKTKMCKPSNSRFAHLHRKRSHPLFSSQYNTKQQKKQAKNWMDCPVTLYPDAGCVLCTSIVAFLREKSMG
jgi:hypothetical protein